MLFTWLSGVDSIIGLMPWDVSWLEAVYRESDLWLSLRSFWLVASSWLCLDRCLVIGGVVLLMEFHRFRGSEHGRENFLPRNFNFITVAMRGWKLDHENFIRENLFLSRTWQNHEIVTP